MYDNFVMPKYYENTNKKLNDAALNSDNYCLQTKIDGAAYVLARDSNGEPHLNNGTITKATGKLNDKIDRVPHMAEWVRENMPPETQLLVEVHSNWDWTMHKVPTYMERESSKYVTSILGALPKKAIDRQEQTEPLKAYVFDCAFMDGKELYKEDLYERMKVLEEFWNKLPDVPGWLSLAKTITEKKTEALNDIFSKGYEGAVVKMLHSQDGNTATLVVRPIGSSPSRTRHTAFKIKEVDTEDLVITQIYMPTSEYTGNDPENYRHKDINGNAINRLYALGLANSFGIGMYKDGDLIQVGTCASGLDDKIRKEMAENPKSFIGAVAEIVYMSKDMTNYTFRHPRFIQIREDKDAKECLFENIFN